MTKYQYKQMRENS